MTNRDDARALGPLGAESEPLADDARSGLRRRELLVGTGALLTGCAHDRALRDAPRTATLDALFEANSVVLPEARGAGANHYPMAAEALEALGYPEAINDAWRVGAASYSGPALRALKFDSEDEPRLRAGLGDYARHGDWLELFRRALERERWRDVLVRWVPLLTPGVSAAVFHGLIRTAHAVRALRRRESPARRGELAAGLAYWAARYSAPAVATNGPALDEPFERLPFRWVDEVADVPFDAVHARLERVPCAPSVTAPTTGTTAEAELDALVHDASVAFLEMLVLERHRLWLLHSVTGPAAAALLVPELDEVDALALASSTRQAVVALYVAFGAPHVPRAHLRASTAPWPEFVRRAAASRSVHTIKLVEALGRYRHVDDALCRSVVAQWFEWT